MGTLDRLLSRLADYSSAQERRGMTRRLCAGTALLFVVVVAAPFLRDRPGVVGALASLTASFAAGWGVAQTFRARLAWRKGYLYGRGAMIDSMAEASRRGLEPHEWLVAEIERDFGQ